jgi:hypothetical protein
MHAELLEDVPNMNLGCRFADEERSRDLVI